MNVIENDHIRVSFSADGNLESLVAKSGSREYLSEDSDGPFTIWHGFAEGYRFRSDEKSGACIHPPDPAAIAAGAFLPSHLADVAVQDDYISLRYRDASSSLTAVVEVKLSGRESTWSLTVSNEGSEVAEFMADFPRWSGIGLSRDAGGKMLAMNQAGYVGTIWHHRGGLYGNSFRQSAQFSCLFEEDSGDCFGFYIEDSTFGAKEIRFDEPDVAVRWIPPLRLEAGQSHKFPSSKLLLYEGSWKETALAYGSWFEQTARPDPVPEWIRTNESYTGAWAEKLGDEYDTRPGGQSGEIPSGALESFDELPVHFLRQPSETIEFAFYCRHSQRAANREDGEPLGPQPRRHTDGWNDIREDLGGMDALARGVDAVHRMGRRVTLYVEGLIVPDDSELFEHIPEARDWIIENADGTTHGPYEKQRFVHMCPGSPGWRSHVVDMCVRLVRESGVDGVRLDSLGFYFWPCHNPTHAHASPYDYNLWLQDLYEMVAQAVRAVNPEALLSTEAPADFNHHHFNHSLHQITRMELPEALKDGVSPLRVALPAYRLHSGSICTGPSMQLQPLWISPGADDAPWLAAFSSARSTISDGDVSIEDPDVSPAGMICRRVTGANEDVVTGASPRWWSDSETPHRLAYADRRRSSTVTVPLGYRPRDAWLFDLQAKSLGLLPWEEKDGVVKFTTDSSWFMAMFRRDSGPNPCWIDMSAEIGRRQNVTITITSPGLRGATEAELRIPGMGDGVSMSVSVPSEFELRIPSDARPAWYRLELSGRGLCPSVSLFRVTNE